MLTTFCCWQIFIKEKWNILNKSLQGNMSFTCNSEFSNSDMELVIELWFGWDIVFFPNNKRFFCIWIDGLSGLYYSWAHLPRGMFVGSVFHFMTKENKGLSNVSQSFDQKRGKRKRSKHHSMGDGRCKIQALWHVSVRRRKVEKKRRKRESSKYSHLELQQ